MDMFQTLPLLKLLKPLLSCIEPSILNVTYSFSFLFVLLNAVESNTESFFSLYDFQVYF